MNRIRMNKDEEDKKASVHVLYVYDLFYFFFYHFTVIVIFPDRIAPPRRYVRPKCTIDGDLGLTT